MLKSYSIFWTSGVSLAFNASRSFSSFISLSFFLCRSSLNFSTFSNLSVIYSRIFLILDSSSSISLAVRYSAFSSPWRFPNLISYSVLAWARVFFDLSPFSEAEVVSLVGSCPAISSILVICSNSSVMVYWMAAISLISFSRFLSKEFINSSISRSRW